MTALAEPGALDRHLSDAERDVVATVLYGGRLPDVARSLDPADFGDPKLREVWAIVLELDARGRAVDPASVALELNRRSDQSVRIDRADLVSLAGECAVPAALPSHIVHVHERAERRRLREAGQMLLQAAETGDLDTARSQVDLARGLLEQRTSATRGPITGLDLSRLDAPAEPLRFLVEGRITETSLTVLGSKPGVGKSWLSQSLAISVASGKPWLGCDVPEARPVLYLDAENGAALAEHRLRQLGARSDLAGRLVYNTDLLSLSHPDDLARFAATLDQLRPGLVVVDTLASHAPDAEADTESAARFYANVWARVRAAGGSMQLLHHLRKSLQGARPDDMLDAFRGAGHIVGAAHRVWHLEAVSPGKPVFIFREGKPREFPLNDAARVSVVDDGAGPGRATTVQLDGTVAAVEDGYDAYLATVLSFLDAAPRHEARTKDLCLLPGAPPERTAKGYIARALGADVLHKVGRGVYARAGVQLTEPEDEDEPA